MGSGWFTLKANEWNYLFTERTTGGTVGSTSQARYTLATICTDVSSGVQGVILFPDGTDFASTEFTTLSTVNGASHYATKCTSAQWAALEAKGCVFLPCGGHRDAFVVFEHGNFGFYWSSSSYNLSNSFYAYRVSIVGNVGPLEWSSRHYGCSVRLVRAVE